MTELIYYCNSFTRVRSGLLLILILLFGSPLQAQGPEKVMACHFRNLSFSEFCEVVFRTTGVNVYYQEEWVNKLTLLLIRTVSQYYRQ